MILCYNKSLSDFNINVKKAVPFGTAFTINGE